MMIKAHIIIRLAEKMLALKPRYEHVYFIFLWQWPFQNENGLALSKTLGPDLIYRPYTWQLCKKEVALLR